MRGVAVLLLLAAAGVSRSEVVDRIAVSVGNQVITASDLDREMRVVAVLDGKQPDLTPAAKRATAERMVEQKLILREMESSRYPMPTPGEVEPAFDDFVRQCFGGDQAALRRALDAAGISEGDVKSELLWQRTLLLFIEVRFRPGVQVDDAEIAGYFEKVVKPAAEKAHPGESVSLEDYRDKIEDTLAGTQVDRQVDNWLREARRRTEIIYHDEVFR